MRKTFVDTLIKLANKDDSIHLLTADLGYGYLEQFQERFPKRYLNVGVAEQNMMNIATGLAMCDRIVYTYSMATFTTMRCLEQIRNYIGHYNLKVRIIGIGGKNCYPTLGFSHNCPNDEDLQIMKLVPNMAVFAPTSKKELDKVLRKTVDVDYPVYVRIAR